MQDGVTTNLSSICEGFACAFLYIGTLVSSYNPKGWMFGDSRYECVGVRSVCFQAGPIPGFTASSLWNDAVSQYAFAFLLHPVNLGSVFWHSGANLQWVMWFRAAGFLSAPKPVWLSEAWTCTAAKAQSTRCYLNMLNMLNIPPFAPCTWTRGSYSCPPTWTHCSLRLKVSI